ncbi:hypothetical protein [Brucella pituitosa]|uniref:hypothetical protein n=1 Tax=Brucella pituitosa TaxID=571256 RepID=UPI003F4ACB67
MILIQTPVILMLTIASWTAAGPAEGGVVPTSQSCVRDYPSTDMSAPPAWEIEKVERVWGKPLREDFILVGGVDGYGWARACRVPGAAAGVFEGEYRDQTIWYRGRFRLETWEGRPAPDNAMDRFYVSHFDYPDGLILYPITKRTPPVKTLRLVPVNTDNFKFRSDLD